MKMQRIHFRKSENFASGGMISIEKINLIRNEFYKVLLELFAYYKDFVSKDAYGDTTFDVKRFQ
jgi:hypothetical protein